MPMMMRASGARGIELALMLVVCAAGASGEITGEWKWSHFDNEVFMRCVSSDTELQNTAQQLESIDFPPFNRTEMQKQSGNNNLTLLGATLAVYNCPYPRGSFVDALATLQYPVAVLQYLTVAPFRSSSSLRAEHFAGLSLRKLTIRVVSFSTLPTFNPDMISSLAELSELGVYWHILPPMPTTSRLRSMKLGYGESAGAMGGCDELLELELVEWKVPDTVGNDWLANCPKLSTVHAYNMPASRVLQVLRGARAMTSLAIGSNVLENLMLLEPMLSGLPLQQLSLPYKMFKQMSENTLSTSLEKITIFYPDWSWDEEEKQRVVRRLARLPALRHFSMKYGEADFCELFPEYGSLPALQQLTLTRSNTKKLCFASWDSLEYLDLSNSRVSVLELMQLPPARQHSLLVDLSFYDPWRPSSVRDIPLDEAGYNLLRDKFNETPNVTIQGYIALSCDCEHAWLARALRTLPLRIPDARCKDYSDASLSDVPIERLECERFECGQCACRRAWRDNSTAATCGSSATRAPRAPGLRALHAAGTHVDTLHAGDLPDTLLTLNLTDSKISRLDDSAVAALFSVSARVIWLAGNPLACDCAARPLLAALQRHRAQVRDFERVTCADGRTLHELDVAVLC